MPGMSAFAPILRENPLYVVNLTTDCQEQVNVLVLFLQQRELQPTIINSVRDIPPNDKMFNIILVAHGNNESPR